MSDSDVRGPTITFECPVCGEEVKMKETAQHNLKQLSEPHMPPPAWRDKPLDEQCPVHFWREDRVIHKNYDFIRYEIPFIFTQIPASVTSEEVLEATIDGLEHQSLGVTVKVDLEERMGYVHAWYHSNQPAYYAVTERISSPQNVLVSESKSELRSFLKRWFKYG